MGKISKICYERAKLRTKVVCGYGVKEKNKRCMIFMENQYDKILSTLLIA